MTAAMKSRSQSMGNGFLVTRRGKADKIAKKAVAKKRAAPRKKKAVKNDDDSDECVSFESLKGREVVFEEEKPKKSAPRKRAAPKVKKEKVKKEESASSAFEDEEP